MSSKGSQENCSFVYKRYNATTVSCFVYLKTFPKKQSWTQKKILGGEEKNNNTPNSDQFYFNGLSWLPAGHKIDYL